MARAKTGIKSGKTAFIREQFGRDQNANTKTINDAWQAAGNTDEISSNLVNQTRSRLGLAKTRGSQESNVERTAPKAKRKTKRAKVTESNANGRETTKAEKPTSTATHKPERLVDDVEAGIDDLIFKIKLGGGMAEVEEALRAARRMLTLKNGV